MRAGRSHLPDPPFGQFQFEEGVALEDDRFAGGLPLVVGPVLHLDADLHGLDLEPGNAEDGFDPAANEAVQRNVRVTRVPEDLGRRESLDTPEGAEDLPDQGRTVPAGKLPGGREIAEALEIGGLRIPVGLVHLVDETSGMHRHGRVQFLATDLSPFELAKELRGGGKKSEIQGVESVAKRSDGRQERSPFFPKETFMTGKRVDGKGEPC